MKQLARALRLVRNTLVNAVVVQRYIPATTRLVFGARISSDFRCGEYCFVGEGAWIGRGVALEDYVMVAPRAAFVGDDHLFDVVGVPMIFSGRPSRRRTIVGSDVWIGYGATILSGVRIGSAAIVAAGSVVTKDVPPGEIWGGVPARKVKDRFADDDALARHLKLLLDGQFSVSLSR